MSDNFDDLIEANKQSRAFDVGEEVSEEVSTEVEPEEATEVEGAEGDNVDDTEDSHADKTRKGRERAEQLRKSEAEKDRLATNNTELKIRLAKLEGQMEERGRQGPVVAPPEVPLDPDETLTRGELLEELRKREDMRIAEAEIADEKRLAYSSKYSELVYGALENHEDKDEILKMFRSNDPGDFDKYGVKRSNDPVFDFEVNLANAERDILRRKNKELSKQLDGKNPKVREDATDGAGVGGDVDPKPKPKVEKIDATDPDSQAFMGYLKESNPKAYEKLSGKYRT